MSVIELHRRVLTALALTAMSLTSAYAATPNNAGNPAAPAPVVATPREQVAAQLFEQGRYADALLQWQILLAEAPNNAAYQSYAQDVQDVIEQKVREHMQAANYALSIGDSANEQRELLKALALSPVNGPALELLRRIESDRAWSIENAKLAKLKSNIEKKITSTEPEHDQEQFYLELGVALFKEGDYSGAIQEIQKYLNSYPNDPAARRQISEAYFRVAVYLHQTGQLIPAMNNMELAQRYAVENIPAREKPVQELKYALAEEYYQRGARDLPTDRNKAIEEWQLALKYNSNHALARQRLSEATTSAPRTP